MNKYSLVTDSHHRCFLKEEGYGYVAELSFSHNRPNDGLHIRPINRGCDMAEQELVDAAMNTLNLLADAQERRPR